MAVVKAGSWVEIEKTILTPDQRAPQVPEDTRKTPYIMNVAGFLLNDSELGADAKIKTLIGRELSGKLKLVNPHYEHSFGETVQELLQIGWEDES